MKPNYSKIGFFTFFILFIPLLIYSLSHFAVNNTQKIIFEIMLALDIVTIAFFTTQDFDKLMGRFYARDSDFKESAVAIVKEILYSGFNNGEHCSKILIEVEGTVCQISFRHRDILYIGDHLIFYKHVGFVRINDHHFKTSV